MTNRSVDASLPLPRSLMSASNHLRSSSGLACTVSMAFLQGDPVTGPKGVRCQLRLALQLVHQQEFSFLLLDAFEHWMARV